MAGRKYILVIRSVKQRGSKPETTKIPYDTEQTARKGFARIHQGAKKEVWHKYEAWVEPPRGGKIKLFSL